MDAKKFLKNNDIAVTSLREMIIKILKNAQKPINCDELVQKTKANKTTIYRNMAILEAKGLIAISESQHKSFYELAEGAKAYFVCDNCHKIEEITMPKLQKKHIKSVVVKGICDECAK